MDDDPGKNRIWAREEVESPCVKVCVIHPEARICVGCYRTIEEISDWSRLGAKERRNLIDILPTRANALKQRRGGRRRKAKPSE